MNHLYFYILLVLNFQTIYGQVCNSSSDTTECSVGEICKTNKCENALYCGGDGNDPCATIIGLFCVSDYCQPTNCTGTGQCVHGHVCPQDTSERCAYPVVVNEEEGSESKLAFEEPATPGNYEEIHWYKGGRSSLNRVAVLHPIITDNKIQYYNEFCSGNSPCRTSERAHLNTDTGELTIYSVESLDEGFYYYKFYVGDDVADTGDKYEYKLNVYVTGDLTIEGLPDEYVEVGTNLTLTCTIDRIRPEPLGMYWVINGRNVSGNITTRDDDGEGVFRQTITNIHRVTEDDEDGAIKCVVVPKYGDRAVDEKQINLGSGGGGGGNVALIGGAIGGILFIVLIIIIVVFITRRKNKPKAAPDDGPKQLVQNGVQPEPVYAQPNKSRKLRPQRGLDEGPQYANTGQLQGENPYENTGVDNNNPPTKQNGIMPPELIYIEVDVGKKDAKANGNKPVPKERSSMRKTKINRSDDPTMYAEIQPKA